MPTPVTDIGTTALQSAGLKISDGPWVDPTHPSFAGGAKGDGSNDTAAFQAAVDALLVLGGGVVKCPPPPVSYYVPGTIAVGAPGSIIIESAGQRRVKFTTDTSTARMFVVGTDDGNHAGGTEGYDGIAAFLRLRRLWLEGPNGGNTAVDTTSVGITDWEGGSTIIEDCFIQKFGLGYAGLGADIQSWRDVLLTFNGVGAALYSRSDQVDLCSLYAGQNAIGVLIESAYATRVFGGQFVGQTDADIVLQQPATSTLPPTSVAQTTAPDIRNQGGLRIYGAWFESLVGITTPRHIHVGRNGSSSRYVRDVQIVGAKFICGQTTNCIEIDAGTDVKVKDCDVIDGAVVSGAFIQINAVAGMNQYVVDDDNRVPSSITRSAGVQTFLIEKRVNVGGNIANQTKTNSGDRVLNVFGQLGLREHTDGSTLWELYRNTGTENAPTWVRSFRVNYKNVEPGQNALTWQAAIGVQANAGGLHTLDASSNIAATIAAPTSAPPSGQMARLTFRIRNTSGGALTTPIAFASGAGGYKTAGAFVNPANGTFRLITFVYDPTLGYWLEESRSAADLS